ncbi:N-6 DNA methylase [Candidatus Sumerlaeota bacterium]|nr:N-6 DNA methylase [Candidatus Sumerlaeota bacterium]
MPAPNSIRELVDRFQRNIESYRSPSYNETQVRLEFINPMFKALGWDVDNEQGYAEAYKDVVHEDAVKVGGATKAPDYSFRVGGARKFFLEAKKPASNLRDDPAHAYQLRRYAWSAKLPLSVLTDFDEFAAYDCRGRPDQADKSSVGRILYLRHTDYLERWDEIASIFSREAVLKGSFDKYAESATRKRGTAEVDSAFLAEIESWRNDLARNIALRNPGLSQRDLNYAVQQSIDRIVFLRICEDRGIEDYGRLQTLLNGADIYARLRHFFEEADQRYNSGLFHFHREKDRPSPPDTLTPSLSIDDKVLKDIVRGLYYPESPYEFSVLPADILGQVYERFLGRVIRLTAGHRAVVEEKPEVRKAGGVYYTPTYIVRYIVENTVGRLLEGRKPGPRGSASRLRILDPACGSGSFLLGAYEYLLKWHLEQYTQNDEPKKWAKGRRPTVFQDRRGEWRLTTAERKRILLNNIYGVDIDTQAVEVTKLSLLLKVLEDENAETVQKQLTFYHERALPDLAANIKCGNSLVGTDFFNGRQGDMFDDDEAQRINAFDWEREFPDIMTAGGFDAAIGNPPYLYSAGKVLSDYLRPRYTLCQYQTDFYVYFLERALSLLHRGGVLSFIVSDSWLNSDCFSVLRNHLLSQHRLRSLVVFDYPVFRGVAIENSILVIEAGCPPAEFPVQRFRTPLDLIEEKHVEPAEAQARGIIDTYSSPLALSVLPTIESNTIPLSSVFDVNRGIHAYRTDGYGESCFRKGPMTKRDKDERSYHATRRLDSRYMEEIRGKHVFRYCFAHSKDFVLYGPWLAEPREPRFFLRPKVALRKILSSRLNGVYIPAPIILDQSLYVLVSRLEGDYDLRFALGVLASPIGAWYLRTKHSIHDKIYPWYTKAQLASFPLPNLAHLARSGRAVHDRLVALVDRMQALHKRVATMKIPHDRRVIERRIEATDREIDRLVYELYGLTDDEIAIVEKDSR